ncbi:TonB family domain-containing protein [uncultured Paludibacter sp.]|uniref:TonB family domain-containing protein n=1 Tax=uncultured Paludibacter sp. TaxID=497635 RepID=A0A653AB29_9BACT|nr:TonB family domain-containing protein [uncultured Paludibacter sp.]
MAREINLTSNEWCNIIFEGKNKEYGAYLLRKESSKRHWTAFAMVTMLVILTFSFSKISNKLFLNKEKEIYSDVIEITKLPPPEKDKEPIRPQIETPKSKPVFPQIKFIAPVIKPDDQVRPEDEIPPASVLTETQAVISDRNAEGDINGVDPRTLETNTEITGEKIEDNDVHNMVGLEIQPSFPGGEAELMKFLSENIKYPTIPQENNVQGKVTVQFVIGKDGSIEDVQIAKGVDRYLDAEAMRVIKSMPKWIPGKQGGRAVRVKYYVPVNFKLQ